jgi:hypothetical protein
MNEEHSIDSITLDDLKSMAAKIDVGKPKIPHYQKSWFERLMNRSGWYRSSEWYLIDTSKMFNGWPNWKVHAPDSPKANLT